MGSRRIRRYSRPLKVEIPGQIPGPDYVIISHWALVVGDPGDPDLLLEVVPISGGGFLTPQNELRITRKEDLQKKLRLFRPFGPENDRTEWSDERIETQARLIVAANPTYNFLYQNCQVFVRNLEWKIMAKNWFDIGVRSIPGYVGIRNLIIPERVKRSAEMPAIGSELTSKGMEEDYEHLANVLAGLLFQEETYTDEDLTKVRGPLKSLVQENPNPDLLPADSLGNSLPGTILKAYSEMGLAGDEVEDF